ncbi:MAG: hypothetical protein LBR95_02235 [Azoarcus sp.]|jgi:hypothetical protein|nr:hypothetical protein [Azoarcus sp.]
MKDIDDIRRENLCLLEKEMGGATAIANLIGMSPVQYINLRNGAKDSQTGKPRGMRKGTARKIEAAAGKPAGWLDTDHSANISPQNFDGGIIAVGDEKTLIQGFRVAATNIREIMLFTARSALDAFDKRGG